MTARPAALPLQGVSHTRRPQCATSNKKPNGPPAGGLYGRHSICLTGKGRSDQRPQVSHAGCFGVGPAPRKDPRDSFHPMPRTFVTVLRNLARRGCPHLQEYPRLGQTAVADPGSATSVLLRVLLGPAGPLETPISENCPLILPSASARP